MPSASPVELVGAVAVLVGTVAAGTVVHELSHATALKAFGVPFELELLPDRGAATLRGRFAGALATVTPTTVPADIAPWRLRTAAMTPLLLATPFVLVAAGVVPDPFALGDIHAEAAAVGWFACALPSPRDFSLLWFPERAIAEFADGAGDPA